MNRGLGARRPAARACILGVLAAFAACGDGQGDPVRGKLVYTTGQSPSGDPLTVTLELFGDSTLRVPGTRYACINCHGPEGRPQTEAGVGVPDIRAALLQEQARDLGITRRSRRPYDRAAIGRAIRLGIDASDNRLHAMMPRFDVSDRDLRDLLAYLEVLGREVVPGVAADEVAVAAALADDDEGRAMLATLQAFAADLGAAGGVYGRRLRIEPIAPARLADGGAQAAARWFAVVGACAEAVPPVPTLPIVGALPGEALLDPALQSQVFWLLPSQTDPLRVAVDHWSAANPDGTALLALSVPPDDAPLVAEALAPQLARHAHARLEPLPPAPKGADAGVRRAVLLAGDAAWKAAELQSLCARSDVAAVYTTHVPLAALAALDAAQRDKLRLLLPVPLPAESDPGVAAFREFLQRHGLPETHVQARLAALAAGATFAEALKRCGAAVTRDRLLRELGAMQRFRPALFPPLRFDASHRVGARGAQIAMLAADGALRPLGAWTEAP